jgi:hypothetical protein
VRENGKPLLDGYCGIWNPTEFALDDPLHVSGVKIVEAMPLEQEAKVELANHDNPYDLASPSHPIQVLVPWKPQGEGIGFPVAATVRATSS